MAQGAGAVHIAWGARASCPWRVQHTLQLLRLGTTPFWMNTMARVSVDVI